MQPHDKLFTPGPVEVSAKTMAAFSRPMIGHRGEDFKNLYRDIHPKLQTLFGTKQPVLLSTSSAWGVMEASIRNLVDRSVLCCMCGAFSDKWLDVARRCGKNAEPLQVDGGKHIDRKVDAPWQKIRMSFSSSTRSLHSRQRRSTWTRSASTSC